MKSNSTENGKTVYNIWNPHQLDYLPLYVWHRYFPDGRMDLGIFLKVTCNSDRLIYRFFFLMIMKNIHILLITLWISCLWNDIHRKIYPQSVFLWHCMSYYLHLQFCALKIRIPYNRTLLNSSTSTLNSIFDMSHEL